MEKVDPSLEYVVKSSNQQVREIDVITSVKKIKDLGLRLKAIRKFFEQYLEQYDLVLVDFSSCKMAISNIVAKQESQSVQTIRLINEMISKKPTPLAINQVIEYLPFAHALHTLNFSGVTIDEKQIIQLSESLLSSNAKNVIIKQNNFTLLAARAISEMLRHNKNLVELNLNGNCFSPIANKYIAESLKCNKQLKKLDVRSKEASFSRIKAMLKVFRLNSTLEELKYL